MLLQRGYSVIAVLLSGQQQGFMQLFVSSHPSSSTHGHIEPLEDRTTVTGMSMLITVRVTVDANIQANN